MSTPTTVPSTATIEPGRLVGGRYLLLAPAGRGGSGSVWRAHDQLLDREVAVKRLDCEPALDATRVQVVRDRARREGRVAARLHHPRLASIYDMSELDGEVCLVMEYVAAPSLAELLRRTGPLPAVRVAAIGAQIADGLAAMHRCGVVHRDVKPGNIMIGPDDTVTVTDFGIAVIQTELGAADHLFAGTPRYLAPELARGDTPTAAADLFSLGATLHTALVGAPPSSDDRALQLPAPGARSTPSTRSTERLRRTLRALLDPDPRRRPDATTAARQLTEITTTPASTHNATAQAAAAGWHPPRDADAAPETETDRDVPALGPPPVLVDPALAGGDEEPLAVTPKHRAGPLHVPGRHRAALATSGHPSRRAVGIVAALAGALGAAGIVTLAARPQQEPPRALPVPVAVQPLPSAGPPIVPALPSSATSTSIEDVAAATSPRSTASRATASRAAEPGGDHADAGTGGGDDTGGGGGNDGSGSRGGDHKGNGPGNGRGQDRGQGRGHGG